MMDPTSDLEDSLAGRLLIAMPGMADPFARSVVLVCAHSTQGAMGVVVNRALPELPFAHLLEQLGIASTEGLRSVPVHLGGPVEQGRGFVLHDLDDGQAGEVEGRFGIAPGIAMTTTRDILEDFARGMGPAQAVLVLGYAGWGPGQLEGELLANGWLVAEPDKTILFGPDNAGKWGAALRRLGVEPAALSTAAGHA